MFTLLWAPARLRPALGLAAVLVAFSFLTRVVLLLRPDVGLSGHWAALPYIFGLGLVYDVAAGVYYVAPVALALVLLPDRFARWHVLRSLGIVVLVALSFVLLLTAVMEWLFWEEFGARFNFIAVDYLIYTHEVLGNIRESYPVGKILGILLLLAALLWLPWLKQVYRWLAAPLSPKQRALWLAGWVVAGVAATALLDNTLKDRSNSDAVNELAGNGIYSFFAAYRRNELDFDRYYPALPRHDAAARVQHLLSADGGEWVAPQPPGGVERYMRAPVPARRLNLVLVSIESMGAEFLGCYGDPRGLTPNLDRLARESLWFSRVYATGNRTVRGLEALSLALPPTPGQSIVRRPRNEHLFSLGSVLEDFDYEVLFAYGGYGYFDNMNAYFDRNDYRVMDRSDLPAERIGFANVWGVADEYLFDAALDRIDQLHRAMRRGTGPRPFFVHIMTTSNHRPYTYPAGRIDIASGSGREGAVKYADWAIGHLMAEASKRAWFDDTLFIITADHGANARGTVTIPVDKYRIPVFFYAPKHIAPRRVDRLMSQIDIAPTALGILGLSYYSKFFGRDVLHAPPGGDRAFVANYQTLGYLQNGALVVLQPRRAPQMYRLDAQERPLAPMVPDERVNDAIALYQQAAYAFRNGLYLDEEQVVPHLRPPGGAPEEVEQKR